MAGDMRVGGNTTTQMKPKSRKLWSLQDRSLMSVHLLKANLAEDGCEEAQLDVAKKLLHGDSTEVIAEAVQNENARLAIYWLIKSSEQGNEEATQLLTDCFQSGKGITCQNVLDVKSCVNTPSNDKLTFKGARLLYEKLSNGEEFITTTQLQARLDSRKYERRVTFESASRPAGGFINSIRNRKQSSPSSPSTPPTGNFDPNATFVISSPGSGNSEDDSSFTHEAEATYLSSCREEDGIKLTLDDLLRVAGDYNKGRVPFVTISPVSRLGRKDQWSLLTIWNGFVLQVILSFMGYGLLSVTTAVSLAVAFVCLWSAYNFVVWRKRKSAFDDWTDAFQSVLQSKSWSEAGATSKLSSASFRPYLLTNLACLVIFVLFSGTPALRTIAASLSLFGLFRGRILRPSFLTWQLYAVIALQVLSNYGLPYMSELNVLESLGLSLTDSISDLFPDLSFLPDLSVLVIGLQALLILQYCATKGTAEWLALTWILGIGYWVIYEQPAPMDYALVAGTVLGLAVLALTLQAKDTLSHWKMSLGLTLVTLIALWVMVWVMQDVQGSGPGSRPLVDWAEYERNCHRPAWRAQTVAETQLRCLLKYEDARVSWTGRITTVSLFEPERSRAGTGLTFLIHLNAGNEAERSSQPWRAYLPLGPSDTQSLAPVTLTLTTAGMANFEEDSLVRHLFNLRTGDVIEFTGSLLKGHGGFRPEVGQLERIQCVSCSLAEGGQVDLDLELKEEHWAISRANQAIEWLTNLSLPFSGLQEEGNY